jgi:short-subunit dehydrogenase
VPLDAVYGATKGALRVLSLDMNKELRPLGIDVVFCEGGIGGRSAMFEPLHHGVAAFG